jgi:predicted CopG family antitoxin
MPTVFVTPETKAELDSIKVHPRESYDEVIARIVKDRKEQQEGAKVKP